MTELFVTKTGFRYLSYA